NHLRTKLKEIGQIEIDEIYLGVSASGAQAIIPVQAKGGKDKIGVAQVHQDIAFCRQRFPKMDPRIVGAQFLSQMEIALMEFGEHEREIVVLRESHFRLVPAAEITDEDLAAYRLHLDS
ncbi:MAG: hypothetical protein MH204_04370, partial [Fimbriimonadaceae bacterium]|nr:hypothetical protein [Fimbriimonadaceae bacterium]